MTTNNYQPTDDGLGKPDIPPPKYPKGTPWWPIETAPKEGEFLVCGGMCVPDFGKEWENIIAHVEIEDNDSGYFICNVAYYPVEVVNPTHWMPLPELPKNEVII